MPRTDARRLWLFAGVLALLLALALAFSWSPLKAWLDIDKVVASLHDLGRQFGPLAALGAFALALALAVPLTFLTLVAIIAFGPWGGFTCALPAALLGATISYLAGRALGRDAIERLGGERVKALSLQLEKRGLLAVILVRFVPVAPFAVVNMMAGASRIRLRDLLLGTAIGMTPSTVFMMVFLERVIEALRRPSEGGAIFIGVTVLLLALGGWGLKRWLAPSRG
ncbi:MAG: VTT domain-containing protein [Pseudomonadota bacterium]